MGIDAGSPLSERTGIEAALRFLGTRDHGVLVDILEHAITRPDGHAGVKLAPLTAATSGLIGWAPTSVHTRSGGSFRREYATPRSAQPRYLGADGRCMPRFGCEILTSTSGVPP